MCWQVRLAVRLAVGEGLWLNLVKSESFADVGGGVHAVFREFSVTKIN